MIKRFIINRAKKYIVKAVNGLLKKHSDDIQYVTQVISVWSNRLEHVLRLLQSISNRVSDGNLDSEELESSINELKEVVDRF